MDDTELRQRLDAAIAELARSLHSHQVGTFEVDALLLEVTRGATEMLSGVDHAGVTLVEGRSRRTRSIAPTGEVPRTVDALQDRFGEGPCLESIWDRHTVRVDDFHRENRWPKFVSALLAETPVRSSLSIQLFTNEHELGALNLYSERPGGIAHDVEEQALVLATHAAIGLAGARRTDQLHSALATRDIIGQAKGMIMERFNVDAIQAFALLRQLSQDSNTPLADVARRLVHRDHPPT
ncbi:GAF and ANTAR domain-containing protein [Mycobacterium sp. GA-2829]|uniref:GAF and ANTAR domain-containing protein n=1 Tax=Mycobacterium sp. GA-2829 TaxID=1772283 RepID=UPI000A43504A|nr:GAF and ANTAR domain-containing protein [Mycobacterium sp. GA-2829]